MCIHLHRADASIWLFQFMKAMRDEKGEMIRNAHLLGFFRRICRWGACLRAASCLWGSLSRRRTPCMHTGSLPCMHAGSLQCMHTLTQPCMHAAVQPCMHTGSCPRSYSPSCRQAVLHAYGLTALHAVIQPCMHTATALHAYGRTALHAYGIAALRPGVHRHLIVRCCHYRRMLFHHVRPVCVLPLPQAAVSPRAPRVCL